MTNATKLSTTAKEQSHFTIHLPRLACAEQVAIGLLLPGVEQIGVEDGLLPQAEGDAISAGGRVVHARVARTHEALMQHALWSEGEDQQLLPSGSQE